MSMRKWFDNRLFPYLAGLLALLAVHLVADYYHIQQRAGFNKISPYLFLLLLYGWIVFHNLILFDGLYLKGKKRSYFIWTSLAMLVSSLNMFFILYYGFNLSNPLPQILNFWIYTLLGLGVYMTHRYLKDFRESSSNIPSSIGKDQPEATYFTFTSDSQQHSIPFEKILYLESLQNYVRIHTLQKIYLVRLSMKEAEQRLPSPLFIRISRSHILNTSHIHTREQDAIRVGVQNFKIGKVYKKYVEDQLGALMPSSR